MLAWCRETNDNIVSTALKDASVSSPAYSRFEGDKLSLCYNTLLVYILLPHIPVTLCYLWVHLVTPTYSLLFVEQILCFILVAKSCLSTCQSPEWFVWILQEIFPNFIPILALNFLNFCKLTPEHVHFSAMIKLLEFTRIDYEVEISILESTFGYSFNTKRGDISLHRRVSVPFY